MITQTLVDRMEGDADQTVTNKTRVSPRGCLVVLDEVAFYALSGLEKVFAVGRAVGITFYVTGQKAPGFTDHVGESMQSLLSNANLHIPMKPRGGTGHEVERMAGESQVARRKTVFALWWSRHPIRIRMKQAAPRTSRSQETA